MTRSDKNRPTIRRCCDIHDDSKETRDNQAGESIKIRDVEKAKKSRNGDKKRARRKSILTTVNFTCKQMFFLFTAVNVLRMLEARLNDCEPSRPGMELHRVPETPAPRALTNNMLTCSLKDRYNGKDIEVIDVTFIIRLCKIL